MFEIDDFALEPPILSAAKDPDSVEALILNEETIPAIRAICAVQASRSSVRILFQSFDRRRILTTNRFTFLQDGNAFTPLDKPGLTFGDAINAVYDNGSLLFRSYAVTARFLSLVEVFNEASEDKMKEVLDHKVLHVANIEAVLKQSDSTMRKQFAAISELGVLEKAKPNVLKDTAAEFGIALGVERHGGKLKVEFPETKKQQKEFLTFLTEGYYVGPITGNKYQSNSHRPMKTKDGKK
jgi:hypothetical protein